MTQNNKKTQVKSAALTILVAASMLLVAMTGFIATAATKEVGGNLMAGVYSAPENTNPLQANEDSWIMGLLYDSLAVYKPTERVLPWLADSWSMNGTTVVVNLKSGVTFTDGSALTSDDVVYSYNQYINGSGYYHNYVTSINSVSANGENSVTFTLSSPNSDFFTKALMVPIIKSGTAGNPIGTGPFMGYEKGNMTGTDLNVTLNDPTNPATRKGGDNVTFKLSHTNVESVTIHIYPPIMDNGGNFTKTNWAAGYVLNSTEYDLDGQNGTITIHSMSEFDYVTVDFTFTEPTITLNANPSYFMGRPYVDSVTFVISGTDEAMVDDLNNGRIDVILENIDSYYKSVVQGANMITPLTTKTVEMVFNSGSGALSNSDFRKAISYAIDKDFFVSKTLQNSGIKGDSAIPRDNLFWYNATLPVRSYDEDEAVSVLTQAGFIDSDGDGFVEMPDGTPIHLTIKSVGITDVSYLAAEAQTLGAAVLPSVGIDTEWVQETPDNITSDMNSGNFDMILTQFTYPLAPDYLNDFVTGNANNFMHYSNSTFDSIMEKANTATTITEKQKYIKEAQGILYDDTAVVVLSYLKGLQYYNGNVYSGFQTMINGINNKFTFLNVYHIVKGNLYMDMIPSKYGMDSESQMSITFSVTDGSAVISDAEISISASAGELSSNDVMTDANGTATVTFTAPSVSQLTDISITAKATKPGYVHTQETIKVTIHPPKPQTLMVSLNVPGGFIQINSTENVSIPVTVTANNNPIAGAQLKVKLEPSITGAKAELSNVETDANGTATVTFYAPETVQDISYTLTVVAHKDGYQDSNPNAMSSNVMIVVKGGTAGASAGAGTSSGGNVTNASTNNTTTTNNTFLGNPIIQSNSMLATVLIIAAIAMAGLAVVLYRKRE